MRKEESVFLLMSESTRHTLVNEAGVMFREWWELADGKYHRVEGPAFREWEVVDGVGVLTYEGWYLQDELHRVDGPAWREWEVVNGAGVLTCEQWCLHGKWHRMDGPAWREWEVVNGITRALIVEEWCLQGRLHRIGGPAVLGWEVRGDTRVVTVEEWYLEGKLHRVDGPARSKWNTADGVMDEGWYLHGVKVDPLKLVKATEVIQRWMTERYRRRWLMIGQHLRKSGLVMWPGLIGLLKRY